MYIVSRSSGPQLIISSKINLHVSLQHNWTPRGLSDLLMLKNYTNTGTSMLPRMSRFQDMIGALTSLVMVQKLLLSDDWSMNLVDDQCMVKWRIWFCAHGHITSSTHRKQCLSVFWSAWYHKPLLISIAKSWSNFLSMCEHPTIHDIQKIMTHSVDHVGSGMYVWSYRQTCWPLCTCQLNHLYAEHTPTYASNLPYQA